MLTAAISSSSIHQDLQSYFQARNSDLQKLGQALRSGDLAAAKQEYQAIKDLGQNGPFANGDAFKMSGREQAFEAIGQALQSGDLAGAKQAFAELRSSFRHGHMPPSPVSVPTLGGPTTPVVSSTGQPVAGTGAASSSGPEVIVNLGNVTPREQITIGVNNTGSGMEQLSISVAQQGQNPEQITLNLNQNSNQQIILNLFNSTASSQASGSGVNLSA
ncbi:MAG TPA: hypothetical protein VE377_10545 [Candidatus Dormibacteraeota bacterium]|nr:hypothetical protein [Candidatus Dormibacteraeota bacterium]